MIKIASCTATKYLLGKIKHPDLVANIVDTKVTVFSDKEMSFEYTSSIRGSHLYLFGDTSKHLTELLLAIDGAKRSSCDKLTVILPYYGFGRYDKKEEHRGAIGASVMAHALQAFGVNRVVAIDLHAEQIQGMFQIPLEHIKGHSIFIDYIKNNIDLSNTILCSPDSGGIYRVEKYANKLDLRMVSINKRRDKPNEVASMQLIGDVKGKNVIIIDDMVDTCGTLSKAVDYLKDEGALDVYYVAAHPVLSGKAAKNLAESKLKKLIVSDTTKPLSEVELPMDMIVEVSCMPVLEKVMCNLINDESISAINRL